jgi:hypothetical protein
MRRNPSLTMSVRVEPASEILTFTGRDAWALQRLIEVGENGVTPLDTPGPRWSGYVHKLRRAGLVIETIHESHGDPFPGTHARYVLRSNVTVLDESDLAA